MSRRKAEMVLELIDQATRPARKVLAVLGKLAKATAKLGFSAAARGARGAAKAMRLYAAGVNKASQALRTMSANMAAASDRMGQQRSALKGAALATGLAAGSLVAMLEPAIAAEARMADIAKVVDFNQSNGLQLLQEDIRKLVTTEGLTTTAEAIQDIVGAAGRMGVVDANLPDDAKRAGLLAFAETAAKMAVAFDVSADEAGMALARWRQNLELSQDQAVHLADTVNLLGNTMATNEADIMRVIGRQGVVAKSAGLAANEIAALSATLLAAGASPEIAATGLKNFTNALTRGASATDRQAAVFEALGINAEELAKRMQNDAAGGIMSVLRAFEKIEPYRRSSMVGDLFGEEAKGAITPLIMNADLLEKTIARTTETTKIAGLMEMEYQRQAETTAAQRKRMMEYVRGMAVVVGSLVLPAFNDLMAAIMPVIQRMTEWAAANPELVANAAKAAAALIALKLVWIGLQWGVFSTLGPVLRFSSYLPLVASRLVALHNPINIVKAALFALRLALIATGIGAILVGIAMAGTWIYNNWSGLGAFFTGLWEGFIAALGPAGPMVEGLASGVADLFGWMTDLLGPIDASQTEWSNWGRAIGEKVGGAVLAVGDFVQGVIDWFAALPEIQWADVVSVFTWENVLTALDWASWLLPIRWLEFVPGFSWGDVFSVFTWDNVLTVLDWASWLLPVRWLEFIPGFSWGDVISVFTWENVLTALNWASWILPIRWLEFIPGIDFSEIFDFRWVDLLPDWRWSDIVPDLPSFGGLFSSDEPALAGARAAGGPVRAGLPYLVGERGPEIFTPRASGRIIPNHRTVTAVRGALASAAGGETSPVGGGDRFLRPSAGGGGVSISAPLSVTIQGGGEDVEGRVRRILAEHREQLLDDIAEAERSARRRGHF